LKPKNLPVRHAVALLLAALALPAAALDLPLAGGLTARVNSTLTLGTLLRTENPSPAAYALIPSTQVPAAPTGQLVGQTGGSDLNFEAGKPVSTVLKALVDAELGTKQWGLFARLSAWHDFTLGHASAAYGNFANGYETGAPLSDEGFSRGARFDGAMFRDVFARATLPLGEAAHLDLRVGRQVLGWGTTLSFTNGIAAATNPIDYAAQLRPGALPAEARVPVGMLNLKLTFGASNLEAFLPWESRRNELPGCGTFFDAASLVPHGCRLSGAIPAPLPGTPVNTLASLTERSLLANQFYLHRQDDVPARDGGQWGLALRHRLASGTELGAYAMNTHATQPTFRLRVENVNGATLPPGFGGALGRLANPSGLQYATLYPEDVKLYGLSVDHPIDATARVFGELAWRPNQPLTMNPNDLLNGFLLRAPTALLQQQKNILGVPAGGSFDAYDRYGVLNLSLGGTKAVPKALGAERVVLAGEVGWSHVRHLPDPEVMRYGRPLAYGTAGWRVNGVLTPCSEAAPGLSGVPGKTCGSDGFVSQDSWGVRARMAAVYPGAFSGATLTPSVAVGLDLGGYSYDGSFSEGRVLARFGLRAEWGKTVFAEVQYTQFGGGAYNLLADRSHLGLTVGVSF
jgi:hypothetical protein